ncbi:unnamed protein product, partial [Symbiodinium sp. KB8]
MPGSTCTWTTLALQRAYQIPAHRDVHNQMGTRNYVMEIADETREGLWVEGSDEHHPVEGGDGIVQEHDYQHEDGEVVHGRIHSIEEPVAFDPRSRHAMVSEQGMKWVLSAYTPSGVQKLLQTDVDYLFQHGFPVTGTGVALPTVRAIQRVSYGPHTTWETTPTEGVADHGPQFVSQGGSREAWVQEENGAGVWQYDEQVEGDEAEGEWELFVESSEESCMIEESSEPEAELQPRLRLLRLCSYADPGAERELLERVYEGHMEDLERPELLQEDMAANLEQWELLPPRVAKVEPEFTKDVETLLDNLTEPLRHTHTVDPREVRSGVEKWRASIEKELKVVEKGFYRTDVEGYGGLHTVYLEDLLAGVGGTKEGYP